MPRKTLQSLREQIDALAAGEIPRRRLFPPRVLERPDTLLGLDRRLDEVGLFTLADARALAQIARSQGENLGDLARDVKRQARTSCRELKACLRYEQGRAHQKQQIDPAAIASLTGLLARLRRIVLVAEVLSGPKSSLESPFEILATPQARQPPASPRLAAAELLIQRARSSPFELQQKQRDIANAHELLLRLNVALDAEHARVRSAQAQVARVRAEAARLEGRDPVEAIGTAAAEGSGADAWAGARSLYLDAISSGDQELACAARHLLGSLEGALPGGLAAARKLDRTRHLLDEVGPGSIAQLIAGTTQPARDRLGEIAAGLDADRWAIFELAAGLDGFFEGSGPEEEPAVTRGPSARVPYPSAEMAIDVTNTLEDTPSFVVSDPRLILYDLASGRQLARAWYEPTGVAQPRKTSVRVYVCDASASMQGAHARFRDAALIAELNNLSARAARGRSTSPLYSCFFNDQPTPLERVDDPESALAAVQRLLDHSPAEGGTDITLALEAAFQAVHTAQGSDPHLARASVVLVTDGMDAVDPERIEAARAPVHGLEVTLSFLSLGEENAALKHLVEKQRANGRRAFYYHLSDEEISAGTTAYDTGRRTLLPERAQPALERETPALLQALERLREAKGRRPPAEDRARVAARFAAYFFSPGETPLGPPGKGDESIDGILEAVAEVAALAPWNVRDQESVALLEHLLGLYQLTSADYLAALARARPETLARLESIRLLCPSSPGDRASASSTLRSPS